MVSHDEKVKATEDNLLFHDVAKTMFRGFCKAINRYIGKRIKHDGDYSTPEIKALHNAMNKIIEKQKDAKGDLGFNQTYLIHLRNILCVFADCQCYYSELFKKATDFFIEEVKKEREIDEGKIS